MFDAYECGDVAESVDGAKQIQPTIPTTAKWGKNHSCHDDNDAAASASAAAAAATNFFLSARYIFFDYGESFNIEPMFTRQSAKEEHEKSRTRIKSVWEYSFSSSMRPYHNDGNGNGNIHIIDIM